MYPGLLESGSWVGQVGPGWVKWVPEQIKLATSLEQTKKMIELKLSYFGPIIEGGILWKRP